MATIFANKVNVTFSSSIPASARNVAFGFYRESSAEPTAPPPLEQKVCL